MWFRYYFVNCVFMVVETEMSLKIVCKPKQGKFKYVLVERVEVIGKAPYVEEIRVKERKKVKWWLKRA